VNKNISPKLSNINDDLNEERNPFLAHDVIQDIQEFALQFFFLSPPV
jgi:hypothetical protein